MNHLNLTQMNSVSSLHSHSLTSAERTAEKALDERYSVYVIKVDRDRCLLRDIDLDWRIDDSHPLILFSKYTIQAYITWLDPVTLSEVTKPRYGSVYPWPLNTALTYLKVTRCGFVSSPPLVPDLVWNLSVITAAVITSCLYS